MIEPQTQLCNNLCRLMSLREAELGKFINFGIFCEKLNKFREIIRGIIKNYVKLKTVWEQENFDSKWGNLSRYEEFHYIFNP